MKVVNSTVIILSAVSLFTDMASEMLYPIMPLYLKSIGFSIVLIGLLEGLVEAIAGLSKGYFGKLSDATGKRLPFVQLGYSLSAIAKPLLALFVAPAWVFAVRSVERLGKGIRTGARDALLADQATVHTKATVFGFHKSMDTVGAVLGPLLALWYLHQHPNDYKMLFLIAFAPGLLAISASFLLKEKNKVDLKIRKKINFFDFIKYYKQAPIAYKKLVQGLLIFALFNSADVFLLLKAAEAGLSDTGVIMMYIFYNLVYAIFAFPLGIVADKIGLPKIFIIGIAIFVLVYAGFAFAISITHFAILFLLYGLFAAATDGISKAWITNISDNKDTATAIGTYTAFQSIAALFASSFAGFMWFQFGSSATFIISAVMGIVVLLYFIIYLAPFSNKN